MAPTDVAIVGAGPSGAWTAYLLASRGARVLLLDPSHPREKPCGGGVTGRALSLVAAAVPLSELPAVTVHEVRFLDSAAGRSVSVPLDCHPTRPALVVASRTEFDGLLLAAARRAGAEIARTRVADLTRDKTGFRLATTSGQVCRAAFVVGADGANSLVRRRFSAPFRRDQLSIGTGFFAEGATSHEIVIELVAKPPGYLWSFPRPGHLAIGICAPADAGVTSADLRARTAEWIRTTGLAANIRLEPYAWPIPSLSPLDFTTLDVAGRGWCLVGDAAGLVDPITREGIFFALQSARFAADALSGAPWRIERGFSDRVRDEIGAELTRAARFKAEFFQPWFTCFMFKALGRSERVRAILADVVAGTESYRNLKWRLAETMEIGLMWNLLTHRSG